MITQFISFQMRIVLHFQYVQLLLTFNKILSLHDRYKTVLLVYRKCKVSFFKLHCHFTKSNVENLAYLCSAPFNGRLQLPFSTFIPSNTITAPLIHASPACLYIRVRLYLPFAKLNGHFSLDVKHTCTKYYQNIICSPKHLRQCY